MSSNHKLLIIHRTFLGRKDPKYSFSRTAAIDAARAILVEFPRGHSLPFQDVSMHYRLRWAVTDVTLKLWTGIFHAVAASTTLILDMFQNPNSPSEDTEKRELVESSLRELSHLQDSSSIAARGVQLLSTLLNEESNQRGRPNGRSNKRKYSVEEGREEEFGREAKRVPENLSTSPTSYLGPFSSASFPSFEPTSAAHYPSALTNLAPLNHFDTLFSTPAFQNLDTEGYGGSEGESNIEFWRLMDRGFESNGRRDSAAGLEALGMGIEKDSGTWSSWAVQYIIILRGSQYLRLLSTSPESDARKSVTSDVLCLTLSDWLLVAYWSISLPRKQVRCIRRYVQGRKIEAGATQLVLPRGQSVGFECILVCAGPWWSTIRYG